MKSICIKTNDISKIDYLLKECDDIPINNIILSSYKFKIFDNVIIHYTGKNEDLFLKLISEKIANLIIFFYQNEIIKKEIKQNYFYLEKEEQEIILRITEKIVISDDCTVNCKKDILEKLIYNYFVENKSMILEGFVNFRLKDYKNVLDYVIELSVMNYLNLTM
jgi:hypothetical protein